MLADGGSVAYDWLVVSLGAETATFGVPGVKDNALPFATFDDAQRVRRRCQRGPLPPAHLRSASAPATPPCPSTDDLSLTNHPIPPPLALAQVAARLALLEKRVEYPELVVVGGGYAGVELAAVVAERLRGRARIKLVTSGPSILPGSPEVGQGRAGQGRAGEAGGEAGALMVRSRASLACPLA